MAGIIEIQKKSIVDLDTDAVVNAANEALAAGGGVCGAIFAAAGHSEMQAACRAIGHCETGGAVITPGFKLKAKYVIHAVGPRYTDGRHGEAEKLRQAYKKAIALAAENGCRSVGFPLISAGIFGYPAEDAWKEAFRACREALDELKGGYLRIVFAVLNDKSVAQGKAILRRSDASVYKVAEKEDWKTCSMPKACEKLSFERHFTAPQLQRLRHGHIPQAMEDKWFWYVDGDTLYIHRSWTGHCIFLLQLGPDGKHLVTVNRDPEQYRSISPEEDLASLNRLLDRWTASAYDYYQEWLDETADMLKKAGN